MTAFRPEGELVLDEDFQDPAAFEERWIPHYLPQWSSRERSRARYRLDCGGLRLLIEADQQPWAPEWDGPLRVSNLQTGVRSGPIGSSDGQHRFRPDLVVREEQAERWTFTPSGGAVAITCRANPDPRTMTALWLIGVERIPEESAELCVMEVFGREVGPARGLVGMGFHPFGDGRIADDFEKVPVTDDLTAVHEYAVEWGWNRARWYVDGVLVKESRQAPDYPLQLMLDVFEFEPDPAAEYPKEFAVERVRAWAPVSSR
ncbi:glycoside hydrolase family 16 protein [Naasia sp. SYSU D00057]|uniref:glycoside hydrolase family 16 protein n=1 Tax=Naasia sp. SYSU D00057 TaxID=2817380 RepID=UPI001B307E84|nr:glycoside hydrolase family 16 protein [Naasia sp. SYSU D00057]